MNQTSTAQHINKLNAFRQAIFANGFTHARDAQFELVDALLRNPEVRSFAELSLSPAFRRRWSSAYAAIEDGGQDRAWLTGHLGQQIPDGDTQVFALDTTVWSHPRARTLAGLLYERSPSRSITGHAIVQGHVYSTLAWVPEAGSSWAVPVATARVTVEADAVTVGVQQVQALVTAWQQAAREALVVIVTDGRYSTHRFMRAFKDQVRVATVGRMRKDRVLYRAPGPYAGRGRPRVHGARCAFKEPATWGPPDAEVEFDDARWGLVRLRRWDNLHAKQAADVACSVFRCEVHLERERPPAPLWLGYQGPPTDSPETPWRWFQHRWPIEPGIRFRKERLHWTLPRFQQTACCDRWTTLVDLAYWQLYLARDAVRDQPLPWQKPQANLTPGRVLRGFSGLFAQIGTPAQPPKPRGKSPGWPRGHPRTRPTRHKPTKRGRKRTQAP